MKKLIFNVDLKVRRNADKTIKKCPALLSIILKVQGYTLEDIYNYRIVDTHGKKALIYNGIRLIFNTNKPL